MSQGLTFHEENEPESRSKILPLADLNNLQHPQSVQSYFQNIDQLLQEIGLNKDHITEITNLIYKQRSQEKLDVISNIFDCRLRAMAEMQGASSMAILTFTEKICLLGELFFALKAVDIDIVFCEQVFTSQPRGQNIYRAFERNLEAFLKDSIFEKTSVFYSLLKDEFEGKNNEARTTLLRSLLNPFIKAYDENHADNFIESIIKILRNKFYQVPEEIQDLSAAGLSARESNFLERIGKCGSLAVHSVSSRNKDEDVLFNIIDNISDPEEMLSAMSTFFNTTRVLTINGLIKLLRSIPRSADWGQKNKSTYDAIYHDIHAKAGGSKWGPSEFHHIDILVMYLGLKSTTDSAGTMQKKEIMDLSLDLLNSSKFLLNKKKNFKAEIKSLFIKMVNDL